ncbi:MAG: hypothetical protein SGI99_02270 [Pseudomonadota bacterium]|nr:hypothetical protein [Pseudomonadota bacterium]
MAQHEIRRCLTNLGAIAQKTEVTGFDMLAACVKAMRHRAVQANLVTMSAGFDTALHSFMGRSVVRRLVMGHK